MTEQKKGIRKTIKDFLLYPAAKQSKNLRWYANYFLNNLPIVLEKSLDLTPTLVRNLPWPLNAMSGAFWALVTGANPYCIYDRILNKEFSITYNTLNATWGMITCSLLPKLVDYVLFPILTAIVSPPVAYVAAWGISLIAKTIFDGNIMCPIEQYVLSARDKGIKEGLQYRYKATKREFDQYITDKYAPTPKVSEPKGNCCGPNVEATLSR